MGHIIRSTNTTRGATVERHLIVLGEMTEAEAAQSVAANTQGDIAVVGVRYAGGATDYFPARQPLA